MTAFQILEKLNSKNITLSVDGGLLKYKAPKDTMTDDITRLIKEHKGQLIEILRANQIMPAITIQKMDVCLHGKTCYFISLVDMRQICSRNNKAIFDMASCPVGKWERGQNNQNTQKKMTCYSCGSQTFWRKKDNIGGRWICEVCHPPAINALMVEWLQ